MLISMLKAKLHRIPVTESNLEYEGSLTLDPDDMEAVGIVPYEKILVITFLSMLRPRLTSLL